jgi:hypothetical protein
MTALRQTVRHRGYFERVNWLGTTLRPLHFVPVEKGQEGHGLPPERRPDPEPAREVWMATFHVLGTSPSGSLKIAAQPDVATGLELSVGTEPGVVVVNAAPGYDVGAQPRCRARSRDAPDWMCRPIAQAGNWREVMSILHHLPRKHTE